MAKYVAQESIFSHIFLIKELALILAILFFKSIGLIGIDFNYFMRNINGTVKYNFV